MSIDTSHADDVVRVGDKAPTLTSRDYKGGNTIMTAIPIADKATRNKGGGNTRHDDGAGNGLGVAEPGAPAYTLTAADRHGVAYAIDRAAFNQGQNAQYGISIQEELAQTLVAKGPGGGGMPYRNNESSVRFVPEITRESGTNM